MKVTAVVVTYNRLELLKRCLEAILAQTRRVDEIVLIDNCSTDGTDAFVNQYCELHPEVKPVRLPSNVGGAGGFEEGIRIAVEQGADYVWIMDDDTIPTPTALQELLLPVENDPQVGFANSRAVWTDGTVNAMNRPIIRHDKQLRHNIDAVNETVEVDGASFVSLLVPRKVVLEVGLPIGEFFIWHDDVEYTGRIVSAGYKGLFVPSSIVLHATVSNIGSSIVTAQVESKHRFYYQIRNQMATKRLNSNVVVAFFSNLLRLRRFKRAIAKRADHREEFLEEILNGYRDGKSFKPAIKKLNLPK